MKKFRFIFFTVFITAFFSFFWVVKNEKYCFAEVSPDRGSNILLINSYHKGLTWTDDQTEAISSTIKSSNLKVNLSIEYLDWKHYPSEDTLKYLYDLFNYKYSKKKIDLIICTDDAALQFALLHRSILFSNAPIIFSGVNSNTISVLDKKYTNFTGVIEQVDPENTIQIALKLNPSLKNIYVLYDNTESGLSTGKLCSDAAKKVKSSLNTIPLNTFSHDEIIDIVKKADKDSMILITGYFIDRNGSFVDLESFCKEISKNSTVPLYHLYDFGVGKGVMGGSVVSGRVLGEKAAKLGLQALRTGRADNIPISYDKNTHLVFDHTQLDRFQISASRLPAETEILNKPFSFIKAYKKLVYITLTAFLLLTLFIGILLFYINRMKKMKLELQSNNKELAQLYEDLSLTGEELRAQYSVLASAQKKLMDSEERYRLAIEATNDSMWDWNLLTGELFFSPKWYNLLGYNPKTFNNSIRYFDHLIHPNDLPFVISAREKHFRGYCDFYECEYRILNRDGKYVWLHSRGKAVFDEEGIPYRAIGSDMDISTLKEYQEELQFLAYHDALTGLHNRLYLYEKIGTYLSNSTERLNKAAILFIDTDNFKFVNDTMGHSFGDQLIISIATRLLSFTNENSLLFRLGGDEFVFYLENIKGKDFVTKYAEKIINSFNDPFIIEGNILSITISMGISLSPDDGINIDKLLRYADMAMYKVKERGRNGFYFFNQAMNDEIQARVNIEKYFKKAIANNEFLLYYQPQIDVRNKKIDGFEALIRWQSPELGMVPPINFINIAEETGFIIPLGEWILRTACSYVANLNKEKSTTYKVSVNISVIQILQDNFTDTVLKVLSETELPPSLLELEITESIIMESPDLIIEKLKILREKGIYIALDDFGTGYSSLAYLRNIPITTLKIDKSFIDDISKYKQEHAVTDSIIDLGHKIGLVMIAEGVETDHQLEYLEKNNCDKIQGYLFYKPLSPQELEVIV